MSQQTITEPNQNNPLVTLKDLGDQTFLMIMHFKTFDYETIGAINGVLDKLDSTEGALALITTSDHKSIYNAGLNFEMFRKGVPEIKKFLQTVNKLFARI